MTDPMTNDLDPIPAIADPPADPDPATDRAARGGEPQLDLANLAEIARWLAEAAAAGVLGNAAFAYLDSFRRRFGERRMDALKDQVYAELRRVKHRPAARDAYQQGLPLYRAIKERLGEANTLQGQGLLAMQEGDAAAAFRRFAELPAVFQSIDDRLGIQAAFGYMARAAAALGQTDRALLLAGESLALGRAVDDRFGQTITLALMLGLLQGAGDTDGLLGALVLYRGLLAGMGDGGRLAQTDALRQQVEQQLPAAELERLRTQAPALLETALAAARGRFGAGDPARLD